MAGRPLKFPSLTALEEKIEVYFNDTKEEEWTITGLALALDTSRETLMNYEDKAEYFDTIKKAKERVHNAYEKDLRRKGRSGDIFALKNFGWSDKQEVDLTNKGERFETSSEIKDLTKKLNQLYRGSGSRGDGGITDTLGTETPD